jgi:hypothetical protein
VAGAARLVSASPVAWVLLGLASALAFSVFLLLLRHSNRGYLAPSPGQLLDATVEAPAGSTPTALINTEFSLAPSWPAHGWVTLLALLRLPALEVSAVLMAQPAGAVLWAQILFAETLSSLQWAGVAVALGGILLLTFLGSVRRRPARESLAWRARPRGAALAALPLPGVRVGGYASNRRGTMRRLLPLVALLALLTAACRIEMNVAADIKEDGSGVISAEIGYDEEAAALIEQFGAGEDLFAENPLMNLPNVEVSEEDRDGMHYRIYSTEVADIEAAITEQMAGEGSGLIEQFAVTIEPHRIEVTGRGSAGAAMQGAEGFEGLLDPAQLAESLAVNLRLTLPGKILEHNADSRDGNTLTWSVPFTGEALEIRAVSDPSQSSGGGFPLWAVIVIAAVVVAGIAAIALVGRRRSRRATAPPPPPPPPGPELPPA